MLFPFEIVPFDITNNKWEKHIFISLIFMTPRQKSLNTKKKDHGNSGYFHHLPPRQLDCDVSCSSLASWWCSEAIYSTFSKCDMRFCQITWGWGMITQSLLRLIPDVLRQIKPYEGVKFFNNLCTFFHPSLQKYPVWRLRNNTIMSISCLGLN